MPNHSSTTSSKISLALVSLGCAKNAVDLQVMMGYLLKAGCVLSPSPDEADVVLINTCAFIESAREEAADEILRACELKRAGHFKAIIVAGCFAQRYRTRLQEVFPAVDAWMGIDALDEIVRVVQGVLGRVRMPTSARMLPSGMPRRVFDPPMPAVRLTGSAFAYLKIAEGCLHRCAYCAIPLIRGKYRSRTCASLVAEARALIQSGVKELNLVAQDPMLYGVDLKGDEKSSLVDLLQKLDQIPGDFWIRVLYSYPSEITDDFLKWMKNSPHAVHYIDVPLQHTHPKILQAMARGTAVEASQTIAARARATLPDVTLRTTFLVGFPGERPAHFKRLLADVKTTQWDHLGCFAFSPEEGTPAASLKACPSPKVSQARQHELMLLQKRIWRKRAQKQVGSIQKALIVAPHVARLASQAPDVDGVVFVKQGDAPVGSFVNLQITAVKGYDFDGIIQD